MQILCIPGGGEMKNARKISSTEINQFYLVINRLYTIGPWENYSYDYSIGIYYLILSQKLQLEITVVKIV